MVQVQRLEDLIGSLLDCSSTYSTDESIKNEVSESLKVIGQHQPNTLLTACHHYLLQNPRLQPVSKAFVLSCIDSIVSDSTLLTSLDDQLVLLIINLATQEMTMTSKDSDAEWADAARGVLVSLAKNSSHVSSVLDAVLQKFPPGLNVSPHRYVILTLATVAEHNPFGLISFLTDILSRAVPLLSHIKTDPLRCAWARAICAFCEAIRECQTERPTEAAEDFEVSTPSPHDFDMVHELSNKATYADQAEALYDVMFQWMYYSKDPKTRAEAAECVGELCLIIRPTKVAEDLKRLVNTFIGLYKKSYNEHHMITIGICRFLEATCYDDVCPLEHYLEDLLNALFPNACLDLDDVTINLNPNSIKNHSEAFRCFHVAASRFADKIVYYLLHKMQNVADMQKLGAINVLRHLLNSSGEFMEDKRSLVMMGLRKLLAAENTATLRIKRAIVQLCVALADHAYVDAEGGDHVIAYLVRNLVPPTEQEMQGRKIETDIAGSNQLRTQCAQALYTIASTCICAHKLLWPYLFEFICVDRYSPVVADICKCLRTLISKEKEAGRELDFETGFDNVRVAGRHAVLSRLFVCLCNAPLNGLLSRRAREILTLLRGLAPWFHPSIVEVLEKWTNNLEPFMDELCTAQTSNGDYSPMVELRGRRVARWNDACLDMLSATIAVVVDGDWRQELAATFGKQMDLYRDSPDEKAFLFRCLGTTLAKIAAKGFVVDHLMLMFKSAVHSNATERQGCARGVGSCAAVHTELVLIELENVSKWEHTRKSSGIFSFIKGAMPMGQYTDTEMVFLRATLMLSYGYVVMACPLDTVTQRLNSTVIVFLRHYFANTKQDTVVREAMLETMRLIALAVHPSRLNADYQFDVRNELLSYIKEYVRSETPEMLSSSLRLLAAKASAKLIQLQPLLSDSDMRELALVLTQYILPMCREKSGLKTFANDLFDYASSSFTALTSSHTDPMLTNSYRRIDDDESSTIMEATVTQYGITLQSLVITKPNVQTLTILLKMLQPFYGNTADHERSRAVDASILVLKTYFEYAEDISIGHASDFSPLPSLLARLTPRLSDSLAHVRIQSLNTIHLALWLAHIHKGHSRDVDPSLFDVDKFSHEFLQVEGKLDNQNSKKAIKFMTEIIESRLPQSQVQLYVSALFDMLADRQSQVSSSAAQMLTLLLRSRGNVLMAEGEKLTNTLVSRLAEVSSCVPTYKELQGALVAFMGHQMSTVCEVLLSQHLPLSLPICDAWESIARDRHLFASVLDHLMEVMTSSLDHPFDIMDTGAGNSVKVVHAEPCQYAAAITEIIKNGDPEWSLNERVPDLLALFIHLMCSVSDAQFPVVQKENKDGSKQQLIITPELRRSAEKPAGIAISAIKGILIRLRTTAVIEDMNQYRSWTDCLDKDNFIPALTIFVRSIAEHRPDWIAGLWTAVAEKADSEREPIRLAAVIVSSALIKSCPDNNGEFNEKLLIDCVRLLQNELTDQSLRIRKLCVRGLGELADCSSFEVTSRFVSMAVEAAMAGLDDLGDRNDAVAMESILALSKLVSRTENKQLKTILPQVLLKMRPCFEKESAPLRAASFSLFGELGARVGSCSDEFLTHMHTNIVSILLHLNDDDEEVRKKCATALIRVHQLFSLPMFSNLVAGDIVEDQSITSYASFVKDSASVLALSFTDRVNQYALTCTNYYKSSSARIRANAALLTGCLLGVLTPQLRGTISKDLVFSGLVLLLKDPEDVSVRISATKAIAALHQFS